MQLAPGAVHTVSERATTWSRVDERRSFPEVVTPACWSLWGDPGDAAVRRAAARLGIVGAHEVATPAAVDERLWSVFYGRPASNVDQWRELYARLAGVGGDPNEVARRVPAALDELPDRLHDLRAATLAWWTATVAPGSGPPPGLAARTERLEVLAEARRRFADAYELHVLASMLAGSLLDPFVRHAAAAGRPVEVPALLDRYNDVEEYATTVALWDTAKGARDRAWLVVHHGFHGPNEADPRAASWREDLAPIEPVLRALATVADEHEPRRAQAAREQARGREAQLVLAAVGPAARDDAARVVRLAETHLPARDTAKAALVMLVDVVRAVLRAEGTDLGRTNIVARHDDVFWLTLDEVALDLDALGELAPAAVEARRADDAVCRALDLPDTWVGMPVPVPLAADGDG